MNGKTRFLRACRLEPVDRPPVWLMRQAGRYLPEYRELREKYDFLERCRRPDLAVEISLQPWRRFHMEGVVVFSDILLPAAAMGVKLHFEEGRGPIFERALRTAADVEGLVIPHVRRALSPTLEAIEELSFQLKDEAAVIGFVGSPWTVAAYLTQGGSGDFQTLMRMTREAPDVLRRLLEKTTEVLVNYAREQVRAGADVVQVFDTWGGLLTPEAYRAWSLPSIQHLVAAIHEVGGTSVLFVRQSDQLLEPMMESGAQVLSVGPSMNLRSVAQTLQGKRAFQGNLDPELLFNSTHEVRRFTRDMIDQVGDIPGYIANLGHGVLPQTSPKAVGAFVETVQQYAR